MLAQYDYTIMHRSVVSVGQRPGDGRAGGRGDPEQSAG